MKWKTALGFALISIICSAIILVFGINQSILGLLKLLAIMLSAGVTNLRVFPVFIVILVTIVFSLPLGLLTINLINIDKQCALTKFAFGMSLGITLMTASFTLMGLIGIPITRFTLLTNYLIILLFLLVMNKRKAKSYKNIVNLPLNLNLKSTESFDKYIFFLFLLLFMIMIYPALRYPAPYCVDWMDYGVRIQGIIHSSTITGFYFHDFVHATDPSLLFYPQGFFVLVTFLYHVTSIPVHILLLSFSYFIGFMTLLMIYALGYNFFKSKYIAALAVVSVLVIEGLSRLDTSGFTWIFSLFLSVTFVFLYYETIKKYDFKKALLTGISLSALFMSNPVIALSMSLVPISYIVLCVRKEIITKSHHLRIEYVQAHVIPLVIAMILSLPIFITNYVYMFSTNSLAKFYGISSSISMRILGSLDAIYAMNGGVGFFGIPFPSFVLNSMVGIITFLPILFGLLFSLKQRKEHQNLVIILLFSSLITYIVPHALKIPATYASAQVLFVLPFSLLSAIGISEAYKSISQSEKLKHLHISHIMVVLIVLFIIFGFVRTSPIIVYNSYQDAGFIASSADVDAALWLKENSATDSVVLNSRLRGDWIPLISVRETVYTRLHLKINQENWDIRAKECAPTFYQPMADTSYSIWKKYNISYIFVTSHWYDLGSFLKSPFIELKYFRDGVAVFKVIPDKACTEDKNLIHIEAEASDLYGNAKIVNLTGIYQGIYVKMPVNSSIVINVTSTEYKMHDGLEDNVTILKIKHFVGPVNLPLKVSISNETYIINKTSDKFRFLTTEITFPARENITHLTMETFDRGAHLLVPSTFLQLEERYGDTLFFQFCPMIDWIEIYQEFGEGEEIYE